MRTHELGAGLTLLLQALLELGLEARHGIIRDLLELL